MCRASADAANVETLLYDDVTWAREKETWLTARRQEWAEAQRHRLRAASQLIPPKPSGDLAEAAKKEWLNERQRERKLSARAMQRYDPKSSAPLVSSSWLSTSERERYLLHQRERRQQAERERRRRMQEAARRPLVAPPDASVASAAGRPGDGRSGDGDYGDDDDDSDDDGMQAVDAAEAEAEAQGEAEAETLTEAEAEAETVITGGGAVDEEGRLPAYGNSGYAGGWDSLAHDNAAAGWDGLGTHGERRERRGEHLHAGGWHSLAHDNATAEGDGGGDALDQLEARDGTSSSSGASSAERFENEPLDELERLETQRSLEHACMHARRSGDGRREHACMHARRSGDGRRGASHSLIHSLHAAAAGSGGGGQAECSSWPPSLPYRQDTHDEAEADYLPSGCGYLPSGCLPSPMRSTRSAPAAATRCGLGRLSQQWRGCRRDGAAR